MVAASLMAWAANSAGSIIFLTDWGAFAVVFSSLGSSETSTFMSKFPRKTIPRRKRPLKERNKQPRAKQKGEGGITMQSETNREKQQKSNESTEAKKEFGIVIHNLDIFVGRKTSGIKFFGKCSGNQLIETFVEKSPVTF